MYIRVTIQHDTIQYEYVVRYRSVAHLYNINNNATSVSIFIGCWPWSIKGRTFTWRQIHVRSRQQTCFSFFMLPNPSINHLNFNCIKQIVYIFPCVCTCNRSQKTSQHVKKNSYFLFFSRSYVICDLLHTHTEKCNLFVKLN